MGFLHGFLGNATQIDVRELKAEFEPVLIDGEVIERAYKIIRDLVVFTNKRLVLVDRQGITGKKVEYYSIPYKFIVRFAVETAGRFDLDAELKIWVAGGHEPIKREFKKGTDIIGVQKSLAEYILK
jgi:hypothetical protein